MESFDTFLSSHAVDPRLPVSTLTESKTIDMLKDLHSRIAGIEAVLGVDSNPNSLYQLWRYPDVSISKRYDCG